MTSSPQFATDHYVTDLGDGQASAFVALGVSVGPDGFTPADRQGQSTVDRYELTGFEVHPPVAGGGPIFKFTGPIAKIRKLVRHATR